MTRYRQLATTLGHPDALLDRWVETFARSFMALAGRSRTNELQPLVLNMIEELAHALPREQLDGTVLPGDLTPGSPATRELEKTAAFMGATLSGLGGSGFDLAAALLALRDVLCSMAPDEHMMVRAMFDWLVVVALDAFALAGVAALKERQSAMLADKTPVILVTPSLPAVLLVGTPDRLGLDAIFSRLLLSVVRVGARHAIVDATGLSDPGAEYVLQSFSGFVNHRRISGQVDVLALGLNTAHERAWAGICKPAGVGLEHCDVFLQAVARAQQGQD